MRSHVCPYTRDSRHIKSIKHLVETPVCPFLDWRGKHCMANTADQNRWCKVHVEEVKHEPGSVWSFFWPASDRSTVKSLSENVVEPKKKKDPNRHKTSTLAAAWCSKNQWGATVRNSSNTCYFYCSSLRLGFPDQPGVLGNHLDPRCPLPENPGGHRTQRHCTEVCIPLTPQILHLWKCTMEVAS